MYILILNAKEEIAFFYFLQKNFEVININYKKNNSINEITYGKMPVKKYLRGGHYHLIVDDYGNEYISVGLTSDKPSDKKNQSLHKVYESNGKIARLKRNATIDDKNKYHKRTANFNVDTQSELKAFLIAKRKKRNTN